MKPMTLTVPARPEWTLVLRMAVSGVSALYDVPVDVMDDLNTAVEESCDLLLHQDYAADTLTLTCDARPDGLHVRLSAQIKDGRQEGEPADADVARLIIQTLVRDVELEEADGRVRSVRMTLPARV